jgi:GNAT superfamily N-acetyltransferase
LYSITLASRQHLAALPGIELEAASRFQDWLVPSFVFSESTPLERFTLRQASGHLWVALEDNGRPVGFGMVEPHGSRLWLEELDVLPEHCNHGVGSALVEKIGQWASAAGFHEVVLTTYRDVPWNGPFYAKRGFEMLPSGQLDADLEARLREEEARGLASMPRVAMRRLVAG